eukprot:2696514-Rhodomonas_salina.1
MRQHAEHAGVQEAGCWAVRNLADNVDNKARVANEGGIGVVLGAMWQHAEHAGVQEAGCRAVWNLAANADNSVKVANEGAIGV